MNMNSKESRVAVVTGGAGFIGSHMVDLLLAEGFQVRVIDNLVGGREANLEHNRKNPLLNVDFRDLRSIGATDTVFKDATYIFHFAGIGDIVPSIDNPLEYMSANVMGTVHALEGARLAGVSKFVYAASSSCYGITKELPTTEYADIIPEYPYALSKYQAEQAVFHWGKVYKLPVNTIRIFNAYGVRSRTTGAYGAVFGVFLKQKLSGRPFTVVGDGTQTRDFIYATDVCRAFYLAATTSHSQEIYNVGAGSPQSINYLVALLNGVETPLEVQYVAKRPAEPDCTWADITKIKTQLGWEPKVSFEEGVSLMLAEIDRWQDAPLWDPKSIASATEGWFSAFSGREAAKELKH